MPVMRDIRSRRAALGVSSSPQPSTLPVARVASPEGVSPHSSHRGPVPVQVVDLGCCGALRRPNIPLAKPANPAESFSASRTLPKTTPVAEERRKESGFWAMLYRALGQAHVEGGWITRQYF